MNTTDIDDLSFLEPAEYQTLMQAIDIDIDDQGGMGFLDWNNYPMSDTMRQMDCSITQQSTSSKTMMVDYNLGLGEVPTNKLESQYMNMALVGMETPGSGNNRKGEQSASLITLDREGTVKVASPNKMEMDRSLMIDSNSNKMGMEGPGNQRKGEESSLDREGTSQVTEKQLEPKVKKLKRNEVIIIELDEDNKIIEVKNEKIAESKAEKENLPRMKGYSKNGVKLGRKPFLIEIENYEKKKKKEADRKMAEAQVQSYLEMKEDFVKG